MFDQINAAEYILLSFSPLTEIHEDTQFCNCQALKSHEILMSVNFQKLLKFSVELILHWSGQ